MSFAVLKTSLTAQIWIQLTDLQAGLDLPAPVTLPVLCLPFRLGPESFHLSYKRPVMCITLLQLVNEISNVQHYKSGPAIPLSLTRVTGPSSSLGGVAGISENQSPTEQQFKTSRRLPGSGPYLTYHAFRSRCRCEPKMMSRIPS